MKYSFILAISFSIVFQACSENTHHNGKYSISQKYEPISHVYSDSLNIPEFFNAFVRNHKEDFYFLDSANYKQFCLNNGLKAESESNKNSYFSIYILHALMSSSSAQNGSKGEILNIPYFWHWVSPNPRYSIHFTENDSLLSRTKAPKPYSNYKSYADIDRTPFLYLSDLLSPTPKYYAASCDTFASFGWCSEREMAFVALMECLNIKGKVIVSGNHSWSELLCKMEKHSGDFSHFKVRVDNTFNSISWSNINKGEVQNWANRIPYGKMSHWYNSKAHSETEFRQMKEFRVSSAAASRIESKTNLYLKKNHDAFER